MLEAPHRFLALLEDIRELLGDRRVAVCRELTKLHEEVFRGTVVEAIAHFNHPRGEFALVIEGASRGVRAADDAVRDELARLRRDGMSAREAITQVSGMTGISRKSLYKLWLTLSV